jgi:AAA domain
VAELAGQLMDGAHALQHGLVAGLPVQAQVEDPDVAGLALDGDKRFDGSVTADLDLVYRAEVQTSEDETVTLSLPADNKLLEDAIRQYRVLLVALDPLMSAISDHLDTHVNRQVRQALDPLARLADRTGATVAGIAHFNKSTRACFLDLEPGGV